MGLNGWIKRVTWWKTLGKMSIRVGKVEVARIVKISVWIKNRVIGEERRKKVEGRVEILGLVVGS